MKLLIFIVSLTFVRTQPSIFHNSSIDINEEKDIEVRDTFDLLEEGQRNIILSKQRNLVLVLGNTGSGKSTFLQWLFGDNEKLTAKETAEGTFIIEDGNKRIGNLTINSKTLFPELVMDKNSAYYDCPGFSDTRSTQHDVAITYFIKRVADHAKKVKLVFIVNHSSVRKGLDRIDFMKLLTHATDLVKNIEKFRNSISITATKVDNLSRENDNGRMVLISDEDVINGIAEFLAEVKGALGKDSAKVKYVQLINIFLLKNRNGNYDRIGLFRRPARSGPLSKNKVLQKGKKNIMRILNTLVYTNKTVADFGYTVSDRSKADIIYLMRNIAITVEVNFDKIGDVLLGKYRILISDVETKLNGFLSEDVVDANVNEEVEKTNKLLILGIREISGMVVKIKNLKNPRGLVEIVRSFVSNLKFDLPINNTINIISKQSEYFDFLQLVSNKTFSISLPKSWTLNWENKAQNLSIFHSEFLNYTRSIVEKITIQVDDLFSTVGRLIYDHHKEIVERMKERVHLSLNSSMENVNIIEVSKMKENLNEVIIVTSDLIQDIQKLNNLSLLCERLIKSAKNMSLNETTKIKLKKFLSFLNNKDNILMRKSWALLYKNEVIKISNLTQDFQIFTNSLINIENYRITDIIESCMLILQNYYEKLTKQINYEINSFVNGSLPFSNPFLVQKLVKELSKGYFTTTKLSTESVHLKTPIELAKKMLSFASTLNINSLNEIVANIEKYLSSLNFLLNVKNEVFAMPVKWVKMFQVEANNLTELRDNCQRTISDLTFNYKNATSRLIDNVGQSIRDQNTKLVEDIDLKMKFLINGSDVVKVVPIEAHAFRDNINLSINTVLDLTNYFKNLTNVTTLADKISQGAKKMKLELSADLFKSIEKNCDRLNYLFIASNESVKVDRSWVNQFESTGQYVLGLRKEFESRANVLVLEAKNLIEDLVSNFSQSLNKHYELKLNEVKIELGYFVKEKEGSYRDVYLGKAKEMAFNLNNGLAIMSIMSTSLKSLSTPLMLKCVINEVIYEINGFYVSRKLMEAVSFQIEILNFALIASGIEFEAPKQWSTIIENVGHNFHNSLMIFKTSDLNRTCETVYSLIKSDLAALNNKIIDHFEETDTSLGSIGNAENAILQLSAKNKNENDLFSYLKNIVDCVTKLNVDKKIINIALNRCAQLEYIQAFSEKELISLQSFHNFYPFEHALKFLKESPIWNRFLGEVEDKLSQYVIQSDVSKYTVVNLNDWGKVNKPQGISIDKNNFHQFLDKLGIHGGIRNVEITIARLKALDKVLDKTLGSNYYKNCDPSIKKIVFKGNFIKFSDFINNKGAFHNPCLFSPTIIIISASKTVFIDRDLIAIGSQFKISITAPKWEVIGNRLINLNGADGQPPQPDRASDGRNAGDRGDDGKPGLSASDSGSFTGTGKTFINGRQLSIRANGGNGGRGQHGGNGKDGSDGDIVSYHTFTGGQVHEVRGIKYISRPQDRAKQLGLVHQCNRGCNGHLRCTCHISGRLGQRGGDGGNGGEGGRGGSEGSVDIFEQGTASWISKSHVRGVAGGRGVGGGGGKGGKSNKVRLRYINYYLVFVTRGEYTFEANIPQVAENGTPGR